jgi:hypothetical protein
MLASTLKVSFGDLTYLVDDPRADNGIKACISVVRDEATERGPVSRILHCDRLNLDRAKERAAFVETAGVDPAHLLEIRSRLLDLLTPVAHPADDTPKAADPAMVEQALALLDDSTLLDQFGTDLQALGYAGDLKQPSLLYLVLTSRMLERPMNLLVGGPSSAGKSFLVASVARFFPSAATYSLTGMSERALVYTDADLTHRTLIISEATAIQRDGIGAAILRSIAWEGRLIYEVVESTPEGMQPRRIEKPGPTGLVTTSVKGIEAELETRLLTLTVPDDQAATRTILRATAERANGRRPEEPDLRPWHEAQRWLIEHGVHDVTIPFAKTLGECYPADQVRSRRDFTQLLTLIQACAVLHQRQRERDDSGRIVASEADYRSVYDLAEPVFGAASAQGVTAGVRAVVVAVETLTKDGEGVTVSAHQIGTELNLGKASVSRRVNVALRGGFLVNDETIKGKPSRLRLGDPLPTDRRALPAPETVFPATPRNSGTVEHPPEFPQSPAKTAVPPTVPPFHVSGIPSGGASETVEQGAEQGNPPSDAEIEPPVPPFHRSTRGGEGQLSAEASPAGTPLFEPAYLAFAPEPEEWPPAETTETATDATWLPATCPRPASCTVFGPCVSGREGRPCPPPLVERPRTEEGAITHQGAPR